MSDTAVSKWSWKVTKDTLTIADSFVRQRKMIWRVAFTVCAEILQVFLIQIFMLS